jgi:transcription-repair coupling factor (superfamily II helicase)
LGELLSEIEDRFGPPPEPAMSFFYLVSLRIEAASAGIEEIIQQGEEIIVRFRDPRAVDAAGLSKKVGTPVRAHSNQVRFSRGTGSSWIPRLRTLVDLLQPAAP